MTRTTSITFGSFRLDQDTVELWKGDRAVPLQPRPLAVLSYLAARPGEVVGRDELIAKVWEGTAVTKGVLKVAVRAIREALGDDATKPRYLETVGATGYRFIGTGRTAARPTADGGQSIVGRQSDLASLERALARAQTGTRVLLAVSGEAGVGKTTLITHFLDALVDTDQVSVARGQCLEQYGEGEPYLPVLDALGRLVREPPGRALAQVLRRDAPSWANQLPALTPRGPSRTEGERFEGRPTRMLRELANALEVFTRRRTLVLALEDLQWSDRSTVDLLAYLARRREPARLLIIGSVRAAELIIRQHPLHGLIQEWRANAQCEALALELLGRDDVAAYIATRFAGVAPTALTRVAARIHNRSEGNALFMVNMVNDLVARGLLVQRNGRWHVQGSVQEATEYVPVGLQELIGIRLEQLSPDERRTLEAASVAGDAFVVASVAAALDEPVEAVEARCEHLAGQGLMISEAGVTEWPDGTISGLYRFQHALYRHVLYQGIAEMRRVRLHRAVGAREETAYGEHARARAAQLAMHFTRGRERPRALTYHRMAAAAALDRDAPREAVAHCGAALDALAESADEPGRRARELELVVMRATLHMATRGYAAPETMHDFARARALCAELPGSPDIYPVLRGLLSYHHVRAELADAYELGEELLRHAHADAADTALRVQAHYGHGATLFHQGAFTAAATHLEAARRDYDPAQHATHARVYGGYDPGVACCLWGAWGLALQGQVEEAAALDREGLALARRLPDAFTLAWACYGAGVTRQILGDFPASEALSAEGATLAEEHGFPHVLGIATINRGWALMMQGRAPIGIPMLREGVAAVEATGAALMHSSYLGMLAAADAMEGDRAGALRCFDQGLAEAQMCGERLNLAGLLIGKSHLLMRGGTGGRTSRATMEEAEDCLRRAIEVARGQGARLVELRAAVALAQHCDRQGRDAEGRAVLSAAHAWFADRSAAAPEIATARQLLAS